MTVAARYSSVVKLQGRAGSVCTAPALNTTTPAREIVMPMHRTTVLRACVQCGKDVEVWPSRLKRGRKIYCSRDCMAKAFIGSGRPASERFWEKVDKNGPIPPHRPELGPCWLWAANRSHNGYGRFWDGKRQVGAHVFAYIVTYGEIPSSTPFVIHLCDGGDIACVRPDHLRPDTHVGNVADMVAKGRQAKGSRLPQSRLTEAAVQQIRERFAAGGISQKSLAAEFGITRSVISAVVRGIRWRHAGGPVIDGKTRDYVVRSTPPVPCSDCGEVRDRKTRGEFRARRTPGLCPRCYARHYYRRKYAVGRESTVEYRVLKDEEVSL
jgi:hypothetical protein